MRIALGVTGGIAAYKAAELVRQLQDRGLEVQVVMTRHAREFVAPLTFAALSGRKVITEMFAAAEGRPNVESAIEHIAVAENIDVLLIVPATANVLAKVAHGIADDFLTTLCLATKAPLIVAPAMNVNMWENAVTQRNVQTLRARGVRVVEPDEGYLACGMTGAGRLASLEAIMQAVLETLGIRDDLKGETVLVTAGRTEEDIDAVRYLSNRSSGKMGYALAEAARRRGAQVILVSGPTHLRPPDSVILEPVRSTEEMAQADAPVIDAAIVHNVIETVNGEVVSDAPVDKNESEHKPEPGDGETKRLSPAALSGIRNALTRRNLSEADACKVVGCETLEQFAGDVTAFWAKVNAQKAA